MKPVHVALGNSWEIAIMSQPNPFASPQSAPGMGMGMGTTHFGGFTPRTASIMSQTRGWVLFMAILGYIYVFLALIGLTQVTAVVRELPGMRMGVLVLIMLVVIGVVLTGSIMLTMYAARIGAFLRTYDMASMALALRSQKVFWVFSGVLILLYIVTIFLVVLVGIMS